MKLEHGSRITHAGCPSFFGLELEDVHVPTSDTQGPSGEDSDRMARYSASPAPVYRACRPSEPSISL